jgi:transcriptional regulator with XRE-family HTH domain
MQRRVAAGDDDQGLTFAQAREGRGNIRVRHSGSQAMHAATLVDALKRLLKAKGMTYAGVAQGLDISEASVKRMFSRRDFTLQRLEDVCRIAGIDFADLTQAITAENAGMTHLTVEQEEEIVSDPTLMLVALCAVGNWTVEQIMQTYNLTLAECVGCLTRLDRRRIIELSPGNRIRPLISRTFSWRPDGPIQRYFRSRVEAEFLGGKFDRPGELFLFVSGMLSRQSAAELIVRLRETAREFAELHRDDLILPISQRHGTSLLLAVRPWEPRAFRALRRGKTGVAPPGPLMYPQLGATGLGAEKRSVRGHRK